MTNLKLGDKVKTNGLLSPVVYGKIVRIEYGYFYYLFFASNTDFSKRFEIDKEWLQKPVYTIEKFLPDVHIYLNDPNIPKELKDQVLKMPPISRKYASYAEQEIIKLPKNFDWTKEINQEINQ